MTNKIKRVAKFLSFISNPREALRLYEEHEAKKQKEVKLYKDFDNDLEDFNKQADETKKAKIEFLYPCLYDKTTTTELDPIYFYQDAWAFERITRQKPTKHIDVGSHNKFVAHLSKVIDLTMVDIRPLSLPMESIKFIEGSILNLPFEDGSIESLSSLCVIEHIGLGRYGDPIDPMGSEKAFKEIYRVLKSNAHFYVSVPVSNRYITRFNAGVIFEKNSFIESMKRYYEIEDMKFIANSQLTSEFIPNNGFGTTILLDLVKK